MSWPQILSALASLGEGARLVIGDADDSYELASSGDGKSIIVRRGEKEICRLRWSDAGISASSSFDGNPECLSDCLKDCGTSSSCMKYCLKQCGYSADD